MPLALAARSPVIDAERALQKNAGVQRMLEDIERHQALIRSAVGSIGKRGKVWIFDQESSLLRGARNTEPEWKRVLRQNQSLQKGGDLP